MRPKSVSASNCMDMSREQLLAELEALRARIALLEQCEHRAEPPEPDITKNESMLRLLLEQKLYGVWVNVDGKIAYINGVGAQILGTSDPAEIIGKSVLDEIIHPDYRDVVRDRIKAMDSGDSAVPLIEEKYIRADGSAVDVDVWAISFIYAGKPAILVAFKDITERKRAEEALKLTQFALDNFPDSAIWLTKDGRIAYVNQGACKSLGYSREELLSMHIGDIDPNYVQERIWELWQVRKLDHHTMFESVHVARDGRAFPVEVTSCYTRYGDKEYLITFDRDITERKRAEEALSKNLAVLAKSQEIARLGSWSLDCGSGKFEISDEIYHIYRLPRSAEPTKDLLYKLILPDDLKRFTEYFESMLEGQLGGIDYRIVWPDGSVHYLHSFTESNVRDHDGRIKTVSGITQDITDRKRAEDELNIAKQQAELYLDLMGHDINNMHQVALGYLELARSLPAGASMTEFLDKSVEVLQRSTLLIDNVRKLQKLRDGVFQVFQNIDVCSVLADIKSEYSAISNKTIILNTNGHDGCTVQANELLHDVFSNLINNAIKHTGDGTEINVDLDIIENNGKRYCRVAVEDNGPGVPDNYKERIFNRMHKGTARGMGLGLYLVRTLVDAYGGIVWVEDRVPGDHSKGARFVVMLPAV